jgi:hypothetical protein
MAVLHEEVDAMLLEGDGVGIGLGDALDDLEIEDIELISARRPLVGTDFAVTMTLDSWVRPFRASKTAGGTLFTWATPWMVPVPSRKMGKRSLPLSRRL